MKSTPIILTLLAILFWGLAGAAGAGTVIYQEQFNAPQFRGTLFPGTANYSEKWPVTYYYVPAKNYDGWVFTGDSQSVTNGAGTDGAILLNEGGNASASTTVHGLSAGTKYILTFDEWGDNEPGQHYTLTLALNGTQVLTYNGVDGQPGSLPNGRSFTVPFTATSSDETIYFAQIAVSLASPIIDNVRISTAAPGNPSHAALTAGANGVYYGVTEKGGAKSNGCCGTVFQLTPPSAGQTRWTKTTLYAFQGDADGIGPMPGLLRGPDGTLYGQARSGGVQGKFGVVYALSPPTGSQTSWTESIIESFGGGADGYAPDGGLVMGNDGSLYGVTLRGGAGLCQDPTGAGVTGCGTVFRLTPPASGQVGWTKSIIHDFQGKDGQYPTSGLWLDDAGNLFGTTFYGGAGPCNFSSSTKRIGCGVAFELAPPANGQGSWTQSILYKFGSGAFGVHPRTALVADGNGDLYGTTARNDAAGDGVVFELQPPAAGATGWTITALAKIPHFGPTTNVAPPAGDLVIDPNGVLYGSAPTGGILAGCGGIGCGSIFSLQAPPQGASSTTQWKLTTLYKFGQGKAAATDGALPRWGLTLGAAGSVLGVTQFGGNASCTAAPYTGCGTVFQASPPASGKKVWTEGAAYRFLGGADGYSP